VNQTIHLPLGVHLFLASQCESIHAFVDRDIAKYRLDGAESLTVLPSSFRAVYLDFHPVGEANRRAFVF